MDTHLAFSMPRKQIQRRILIPKYYDPELALAAAMAEDRFDLPTLGELLLSGQRGSRLGIWIPRDLYGSGDVPFVRTSDLIHWRIRPDFKKGVAMEVYDSIKERQDVIPSDILMVAHGTYLVGNVAIVTEDDLPLVLQDHVFRLRVSPSAGIDARLLLVALSTAFVRRQVRARQFSADIIDKVGDRHLGVQVPIPQNEAQRSEIVARVDGVVREQSAALAQIRAISQSDLKMSRERADARLGFSVRRSAIKRHILIPKYYDPTLDADLGRAEAEDSVPWMSLGDLVAGGIVSISAGVEVGKMAYGTGGIPFVRTSDLVGWEIRRDAKQGVSDGVYSEHVRKGGVESYDILVVRDGTYLVGSSAIVMPSDTPALICGGIYRVRVSRPDQLDPHALLALLNTTLARRQMRARQFTRDVIDTLGRRILEVRIPDPTSSRAAELATRARSVMKRKEALKRELGAIIDSLEPASSPVAVGRPGWSMR